MSIKTLSEIELVPLADIRPYWRNPRQNDAAVPGVKESIQHFGINQPLVVDKKGVIIVGHTRYRALVELGVESVPVVRADHLNAKQAKAYRIADNKTAERATWDNKALIPELRDTDLDIMGLFFDERDLAQLLENADGQAFKPVDAETMDKALTRSQTGGPGTRQMDEGGQIKLTCPHCVEDFYVDRRIIEEGRSEK